MTFFPLILCFLKTKLWSLFLSMRIYFQILDLPNAKKIQKRYLQSGDCRLNAMKMKNNNTVLMVFLLLFYCFSNASSYCDSFFSLPLF